MRVLNTKPIKTVIRKVYVNQDSCVWNEDEKLSTEFNDFCKTQEISGKTQGIDLRGMNESSIQSSIHLTV